jgi:hypothetical protein
MAITLKPFRQYDEHDVINMFTYDVDATVTAGVQANAGLVVGLTSGGWKAGEEIHDLSVTQPNAAVNNNSYGNTLSLRYNLLAEVVAFTGTTDDSLTTAQPLGMLLHDVRTLDENGEDLRYNPRKADEMQVVVPGQAVPIVTRGMFLFHDTADSGDLSNATAGERLTVTAAGLVSVAGDLADPVIGKALGDWDAATNTVLVMLNF